LKQISKRLTYANVMSSIAVFLILGGASAFAASHLGKNSVGTKQLKAKAVSAAKIKASAVTSAKINKQAVTAGKIAAGAVIGEKIGAGAVTGEKVVPGSLTTAALSDVRIAPTLKVAATSGADYESAREAAPPHVLFSNGPLKVYAKCFTDSSEPETVGAVYAATTEPGSVFYAARTGLDGNPFLDPTTPEVEREMISESTGENSASSWRSIFTITAADGTQLTGQVATFVKNGTLEGGDAIYGAGDVCVFNGLALG
jgi:hypothetical protein